MLYHVIFIGVKNNVKKYIIFSILGGIIATIIFMALSKYGVIAFSLVYLTAIIAIGKIHKKSIAVNIVQLMFSSIIIILIELIVMALSILIVGHNELPLWAYIFIFLVIIIFMVYLCYKIMKFDRVKVDYFIEKYNSIVIICINIIIIFLFFKVLYQNKFIQELQIVESAILFLAIIVINVFYFIDIYRRNKNNKREELKESINPLIQELIDEMKASEHEYKNHLNILYCMIQVCKEDELRERAKKYIGNVFENKNLLHNLAHIDNTILKAVLLSKINYAEKHEIECKYYIGSQLRNLPLDDSELTVVLSNLLNNAIEAAGKSERKYIEISTAYNKEKYIISVSNSVSNFTEEMITNISKVRFSTKGKGRGYGVYNIKNIVSKYKGKLNMSLKDDMFNIFIEI